MSPADEQAVKALVAAAPLPTPAQRDRLAQLLRTGKQSAKAA